MKNLVFTVFCLLSTFALGAKPAAKPDPVAAGFPVWQNVTPANHVTGRILVPSDLRHKVTIVLEVEMNEKLVSQLSQIDRIFQRTARNYSLSITDNWDTFELKRDLLVAVSLRGANAKTKEQVLDVLSNKDGKVKDKGVLNMLGKAAGPGCSWYQDLTFAGAPDTTGKRPYIYVFGPTGAEPLCHGPLDATLKDAFSAMNAGSKTISEWETKWRPFYGNVGEPKFNTTLKKAMEKKAKKIPLEPIAKSLLTDVTSKDEAKAKEAQILYDAINQTRSDLLLQIGLEANACSYRAWCDMQTILKYWPTASKELGEVQAKLKSNPYAETLGKIYQRLSELSDPTFTCKNAGEAKKIGLELNKMKKTLAPLKESQNISLQNGALLLDMKLDELIQTIPNLVKQ